MHLLYEDPTIDCMDLNTGLFGRGEPGNCAPLADPAQEARYLGRHHDAEVLKIDLLNGGARLSPSSCTRLSTPVIRR